MPINDNLFGIEDILSIFSIYQNPSDVFEILLVHYDELEVPHYFLHVNGENINFIDKSKNKEWHWKVNDLENPWKLLDYVTKVNPYLLNDLFNFLSNDKNRATLMPDSKWADEIKAKIGH